MYRKTKGVSMPAGPKMSIVDLSFDLPSPLPLCKALLKLLRET